MSVFELSQEPIDTAARRRALEAPGAGAVVVFEGCVRNVNEGREVATLEYEAAAPLAKQAWDPIEREAIERFEIIEVHCVHRTGRLAIGDTAVWIGVLAGHRAAAFDACRYVIDELKMRLPVWKKEHYTDGSNHWINSP